MARRAADLSEESFPCLSSFQHCGMIRSGAFRWRQLTQKNDQRVTFVSIQIKAVWLILWLMRKAGLRMIWHMQTQLDSTRRHCEIVQVGHLSFPTESPNFSIRQSSHSPADVWVLGMPSLRRINQHGIWNRIDQSGTKQRSRVPLTERQMKLRRRF